MPSKEEELVDKITSQFDAEGWVQRKRRLWVSVGKQDLLSLCTRLKDIGFEHLSAISVTDWLEDDIYEVTYHVWSYEDNILVTVKTEIDRDDPHIESVVSIWNENAQIHERELHEMFGVEFEDNPDLEPLFLEDWSGPPPFRKDFNWREHVQEEFYDEEDERESAYFD